MELLDESRSARQISKAPLPIDRLLADCWGPDSSQNLRPGLIRFNIRALPCRKVIQIIDAQNRTKVLFLLLVAFALGTFLGTYFGVGDISFSSEDSLVLEPELKCTDEYASYEDYVNSASKWLAYYLNRNPSATDREALEARANRFKAAGCQEYKDLGAAGDEFEEEFSKEKFMNAIRYAESQRPPGISNDPTREEISQNPYIGHLHRAFRNYLNGISEGIEPNAFSFAPGTACGLDGFSKDYYRSEFYVYDAGRNEFGGVWAHIIFNDKPDSIFWAWIYRYGDNQDSEYVLRTFCKAADLIPLDSEPKTPTEPWPTENEPVA